MLVWLKTIPIHAPLGGFGAHFLQMMSLIVVTPKRTVLWRNHVIWAINRENRSRGSSWACEREKKTGQHRTGQDRTGQDRTGQDRTGKKVTKGLYFTYLWRSPHWSNVHEHLFSGRCSRRYHVCQVSKRNLQGVEFSIFLLIFEWALQQCSATALPVI